MGVILRLGSNGATTFWIVVELEVFGLFGSVIVPEMNGKPNKGKEKGEDGDTQKY